MPFAATHISTATLLLEIGPLRILTDPVFDAPGRKYSFGWGTSSRRLDTSALPVEKLGKLDAVLISHDQHADNLDDAGRALLPRAAQVVTTHAAARRLQHANLTGLKPFESTRVGDLRVTATPARHGPPGSLPIVGHVVGFVLEADALPGPVYISGDTVWFDGVAEVARRFRIHTAFLHLGSVGFSLTGPLRYTFDAKEAVIAANALNAPRIIPVHYSGWSHFRQKPEQARQVFSEAGLDARVKWLTPGERTVLD
ncbi:MBL fold metallo-hydrolase [Myxococcus sp. CA051A]|uniref:MBL fold metallo-hydrolase n=1 Tax=unclassified Myxococcus TaxID=2648731 RepID=UPI00157B248A|nr:MULTISPECIES: MBL fold metallo-hydrolase [unclassified Myxococcus]NTX15051.1 MBL fold metallo-hydrolase [Myxococcus sp. CA056]NTX36054.1 MBL fold metallo-hydrolase [Myxococcus sp. CA033]NTX63782.1 MBL fold metallo-hydrolase [Myxococcus sp. CA051A]